MTTRKKQSFPLEAQYLYRRGLDLKNQKRDEEALRFLKQAVVLYPGYSRARLEIGDCMTRLGRHNEACEYMSGFIALNLPVRTVYSGRSFHAGILRERTGS